MYTHQPLTKREKQIARFIKLGLTNKEIANELFLSPETIKHNVSNLLAKTDYPNRDKFRSGYHQPLFPKYVKSWNSEAIKEKFTTS